LALPREGCVVAGRTVEGTVDAASTEDTVALSGDWVDPHDATHAPTNNVEITCRHIPSDCPVFDHDASDDRRCRTTGASRQL
jgi:hypothetical protein